MKRLRVDYGSHGQKANAIYKELAKDARRHAEIIHFMLLDVGWWSIYYFPIREENK